MVSQFVSISDLVDHDGIASAYIRAQISMRQGDSRVRKGYTLCVRMQFLGVDTRPVNIEDNGLVFASEALSSHFVQ